MSFGVSDDNSIHSHMEDFSCWVEGWSSQILALPRWYLPCTVPLSVLSIHSLGYLLKRRKYILLLSQSCLCCHKNTRITKNTDKNIQHSYTSKVSLIHTQIPSFSLHDFHRCKLIFWSLAQPQVHNLHLRRSHSSDSKPNSCVEPRWHFVSLSDREDMGMPPIHK